MKIGIAADHWGYKLKEKLKKDLGKKYEILDYGTNSEERTDYPDYALKLGEAIRNKEIDFGVAICGTGIGMSIALNKMKNITCAKVNSVKEAKRAKEHNHANTLAMPGSICACKAKKMIEEFLNAKPNNEEAYLRRIEKVGKLK